MKKILGRISEAGKDYEILFLKTTMTMPYTSVFLQLACKYCTSEGEQKIRQSMKSFFSEMKTPKASEESRSWMRYIAATEFWPYPPPGGLVEACRQMPANVPETGLGMATLHDAGRNKSLARIVDNDHPIRPMRWRL